MTGYRADSTAPTSTGDPRALCRDAPDLHFPVGTGRWRAEQIEEAKEMCQRCPLTASCLAWSLDHREPHGVWGGLDEDERRELLRGRHLIADEPPQNPVRSVQVEQVRTLAARGYTDRQVADQLGGDWSRQRVCEFRHRHNIPAGRSAAARRAA